MIPTPENVYAMMPRSLQNRCTWLPIILLISSGKIDAFVVGALFLVTGRARQDTEAPLATIVAENKA